MSENVVTTVESAITDIFGSVTEVLRSAEHGAGFVPDVSAFAEALSALYWASLVRDEGRYALGAVVFVPDRSWLWVATSEGAATALLPDALASRLRTVDPLSGGAAVIAGKLAGIVYRVPLDAVVICAEAPAELSVRVGRTVVGTVVNGAWTSYARARGPLSQFVGNSRWQLLIDNATPELQRLAHGGAIIIQARHTPHVGLGFGTRLDTKAMRVPSNDRGRAFLAVEVARLARMTDVDGALVVRDGADADELPAAHAFGIKIQGDQKSADVPCVVVDAESGAERVVGRLDELGGMRHQSAARYAGMNPGDLVVVVSQDGHASLMRSQGGVVRVLVGWLPSRSVCLSQALFVHHAGD